MHEGDTIAAISTPIGEAGIGIVRLSGGDAIKIADLLFSSPSGKSLPNSGSHRLYYGFIKDPLTAERVDEVIVSVMRAPLTYTKEDVIEINCHGGIVPLRRVLELTLRHGARLAGPGEFTKRAFLNGRIDLTQAEAVLDLIRAKTGLAEKVALAQLSGSIRKRIDSIKENLLNICAHIEAYIDFPEEDIETSSLAEIRIGLEEIIAELTALSKSYDEGRFLREGLKAVIVGRPNVGKSSLLNALIQKDRAIVMETPGTTRDVIEDFINIDGLPLRVMDTAGIRQSHDMVEREGVRRSLRALDEADLAIAVIDGSVPLKDEDIEVLEKIKGKSSIVVIAKSDLPPVPIKLPAQDIKAIRLSALTGKGIDALKEAIFNSFISGSLTGEGGSLTLVTNIRHKTAIDSAINSLGEASSSLASALPIEITAMALREGLDRLSELTGTVTTEDILERIFSSFCIGK